jgi:tRNA modification GTPase
LAVIRLSGPRALPVAEALFRSSPLLSQLPSHTLRHGRIVDGDVPVDDAVAAVFRAPASYTGEDVVELSCHGGWETPRRVLALCLALGARPAEPGEFTRRAYLNGKMDLAQADAVALLTAAHSEAARRAALEQLRGGLSRALADIRRPLVDLVARLEAAMDFVEDEVPDLSPARAGEETRRLLTRVEELLLSERRGRLYREGLHVVLAGPPNAGKSSLFNALLGRDRAIVTPQPGTTRDTLEESFPLHGMTIVLHDTAGLRAAEDPAEQEGIARTRRALETADVALWLRDLADPRPETALPPPELPTGRAWTRVATKCDLVPPAERPPRAPGTGECHYVSAHTGEGLAALRDTLARRTEESHASASPTLLRERHGHCLREAQGALRAAAQALDRGTGTEAVCLDLRRALDALGRITGETADKEILDAVFSTFCVGK